jgi:hypothetical protein
MMDVFDFNFDEACDSVLGSIKWTNQIRSFNLVIEYPSIDCDCLLASKTAHKIIERLFR